jgi:hypothetical protein
MTMDRENRLELMSEISRLSSSGCTILFGVLLSRFHASPNMNFWAVLEESLRELKATKQLA